MASNRDLESEEVCMKRIQLVLEENKDVKKLKVLAEHSGQLQKDDISAELINIVWRIWWDNGDVTTRAIAKIALPYLKISGPDHPLAASRLLKESRSLKMFNKIILGSGPEVYCYSDKYNIMIMEDLYAHTLLDNLHMDGNIDLSTIEKLAYNVAQIHNATHVSAVPPERFHKLQEEFADDAFVLDGLYLFVLEWPFTKAEPENATLLVKPLIKQVLEDKKIFAVLESLRKCFLESRECLTHGDLHSGNILVENEIPKIFDNEGCRVGPCSLDMGWMLCSFHMCHYSHMTRKDNTDWHRQQASKLVEAARTYVKTYLTNMRYSIGDRAVYIARMMSEVAGLCAINGLAYVMRGAPRIQLTSEEMKVELIKSCIRLLHAYGNINSIDELLTIAYMTS